MGMEHQAIYSTAPDLLYVENLVRQTYFGMGMQHRVVVRL